MNLLDIFAADLLDLGAEADLVNLVGKVVVVRLDVHRVRGQMEIAGHLQQMID